MILSTIGATHSGPELWFPRKLFSLCDSDFCQFGTEHRLKSLCSNLKSNASSPKGDLKAPALCHVRSRDPKIIVGCQTDSEACATRRAFNFTASLAALKACSRTAPQRT